MTLRHVNLIRFYITLHYIAYSGNVYGCESGTTGMRERKKIDVLETAWS